MSFQAKLETESEKSDLVKPVLDAQTQLNRLRDLMQSLFRSQYFLNETAKQSESSQELLPRPEDINVEYTYAHVNKQSEEDHNIKPTESTRLEIFKSMQTPRQKAQQFNLDFFSPITSVIKTQYEQDYSEDLTGDQPTVTFNCPTEKTQKPDLSDDPSLTKYNLSDLSRRLGGTQLYISRDNGLDITDNLNDDDGDTGAGQNDVADTTKYTETMEELEQLMVKLSDVFTTFRESPSIKTKDEDPLLGLVNGFNEDIYGFISKSKESSI